jgi:phosphatidyl-myo-inositol dimannoside synthase
MRVLFLGLKIFSATGGIEQVNKNWLFALNKLSIENRIELKAIAMYDASLDERYITTNKFIGCKANKWAFGLKALWNSINADVLIITHLNLSLFALLAKLINPRVKIIIQLHGIEAWANLSGVQERLLMQATKILAVSNFTYQSVLTRYSNLQSKLQVLSNSLDPINTFEQSKSQSSDFRKALNIDSDKKLIITIGRLLSSEAYKGYDKTIEALAKLNNKDFVFHIIGKYEQTEYTRVNALIEKYNLGNQVKLIGFVKDEELNLYYNAADLFVMPSKGEGFGLVFIDAMANGLRVIGGNVDGSVDAISAFDDCYLINPDDTLELANTIELALSKEWNIENKQQLSNKCIEKFSSINFGKSIEQIILH